MGKGVFSPFFAVFRLTELVAVEKLTALVGGKL
jgi:hypothetical protein